MGGVFERECPLCRAIDSSSIEFEDEHTVVLHPLEKRAPIHLLVVSRRHHASLHELAAHTDEVAALLSTADLVATRAGILDSGYRYVMNSGPATDQTVAHPHLHVLGGDHLRSHP